MENNNSNQIYITKIKFPFETIENILKNPKLIMSFCESSPIATIKSFLGSNINIDGSGYLWQGKNNNSFCVECTSKYLLNFSRTYNFKIIYINESFIKQNISILMNLYKNTYDKTCIIEFCFFYLCNNNYIKFIKNTLLDFNIKDFLNKFCYKLKNYLKNSSEFNTIYHSLIINMNYNDAYKIFRDFTIYAKVLGTDKFWDIKYDNNSIYSVNMNNGISIDYHIYKEEENEDKSKSIFYHKFKGNIPSLNEWIQGHFYKISNDKCFIVLETKIPLNINSYLHKTIYQYTFFVLRKWKFFVESHKDIFLNKI